MTNRKIKINEEKTDEEREAERAKEKPANLEFVEVLGRAVTAVRTSQGLRAAINGEAISAESVVAQQVELTVSRRTV